MRKCGVCVFGGRGLPRAAPSAACVLASSRDRLGGAQGALALMEDTAAEKPVGSASAYCTRCRRITWLCREDADLSAACVEFWRNWRATESVVSSLRLVLEHNGPKKRRLCKRAGAKRSRGTMDDDGI